VAASGSFFIFGQITNHLFAQSQMIDVLEVLPLESLDEEVAPH